MKMTLLSSPAALLAGAYAGENGELTPPVVEFPGPDLFTCENLVILFRQFSSYYPLVSR
jgi:hypothetical protein